MSHKGNTKLPDRLARQLAGQCLYGRCPELALDGRDYCGPHDEGAKARKRKSRAKKRAALREAKLCRDCPRPAKRSRCPKCRKAHRVAMRKRRGVDNITRGVDNARDRRGHVKVDHGDHREGRNPTQRYVGRERRGAPSREDLNADIVQDAGYAKAEIDKFLRAFALATSHEIQSLPRIQREGAQRIVTDHAAYAARILDDIVDRLK